MRKILTGILLSLTFMLLSTGGSVEASAVNQNEQEIIAALENAGGTVFPIGKPNVKNIANFTGDSYVAWLSDGGVPIGNVTFVNGAHTHWHVHHKSCQVLVAESGRGYYQIWGEEPHELLPGQTVTIPEGVKHWHGAAPGCMFQHLSITKSVAGVTTEWFEEVNPADYDALK